MTAEVVARRTRRSTDGTPPIHYKPTLTPEPEPTLYRPLQEEELMQLKTTDQLLPHVYSAAHQRFPFRVQQLMGAVDIAITQYDGHKPRRDGTEAALHPVRTLYRALIADPDMTPVQGAILALHDTIEDCNVSQRDLEEILRMRDPKFSDEDIKSIAFGANQLSRIQNGKKLFPHEYIQQLDDTHWADPDLGIINGKSWDAIDNTKNDVWMLIHDPASIDPERVLTFLSEKAEDVLTLAKQYAPRTVSTNTLAETIRTSRELSLRELELRELGIREDEMREVASRRRQPLSRRILPTTRVPV